MKFKEKTVLFRTIVGSHMWGQNYEGSDLDLFEAYIFDSRSFLLGNKHTGGHSSKIGKRDKDSFEIGHIVKELQKGNINFIWGVMSPKLDLVTTNIDPNMWDLRKIVRENLSKNCVHSIRGFVIHNLKHWFGVKLDALHSVEQLNKGYVIVEKKEPRLLPKDKKYWKILNTCARTLSFGIDLFKTNGKTFYCYFDNPRTAKSVGEILVLLAELEEAYNESTLREKPNREPFEKFLIAIRRREWLIDVIFRALDEDDMSIDEFCKLLKGIKDCREGNFVEL